MYLKYTAKWLKIVLKINKNSNTKICIPRSNKSDQIWANKRLKYRPSRQQRAGPWQQKYTISRKFISILQKYLRNRSNSFHFQITHNSIQHMNMNNQTWSLQLRSALYFVLLSGGSARQLAASTPCASGCSLSLAETRHESLSG